MEQKIIVAVLGYGCYLNPLEQYLRKINNYIKTHEVKCAILAGGFTNPTCPDTSEASMMRDYLIKRVNIPLVLEEKSFTTNQNLMYIKEIIEEQGLQDYRLIIFCDTCRKLKVKILSRLTLGFWPKIKTHNLTTSWFQKLKQLLVATPGDILAFFFPLLEELKLKRRQTN